MHKNPTEMHVHERNNIQCGSMVLHKKKCDRAKATGCNFWYGSLNSRFISSFTFDPSPFAFHYLLTICEILICFSISCYAQSIQYDSVFKWLLLLLLHFWFSATRFSFHLVTWSCLSISGKSMKTSSKSLFFSMVTSQYVFAHTFSVLLYPLFIQVLNQLSKVASWTQHCSLSFESTSSSLLLVM